MKKITLLILAFLMAFNGICVAANDENAIDSVLKTTADYLVETVREPCVGSIGGEWAVIGLARSGLDVPSGYFENYYQEVVSYVKECDGKLHDKKYTEYSRVILALTAIGKEPKNVAGFDLVAPLGDFEKTVWQGINGSVWALIALDCGSYEIDGAREYYINHILENQKSDGGWALSGEAGDADLTAMALIALAKYREWENVNAAVERGLQCLSKMQNETGCFSSNGAENAESSAQVLTAMCTLGISCDDPRFVKNGHTVLDGILQYRDGGGFKHIKNGNVNQMATEQCFYSLVALDRFLNGKNDLYDMRDVKSFLGGDEALGLPKKHGDVKKTEVIYEGKSFSDIEKSHACAAIECLSERGIISGKTDDFFDPSGTMTRAEFATIIVNGLGLPLKGEAKFDDCKTSDWFFGTVNTAYFYGIVSGVSDTEFNPHGTITREEAAVMVARAAVLCGHTVDEETNFVRDTLAGFTDYVKASSWAQSALAFCFDSNILSDEEIEIKPKAAVTRGEIAQMLYNLLENSMLI